MMTEFLLGPPLIDWFGRNLSDSPPLSDGLFKRERFIAGLIFFTGAELLEDELLLLESLLSLVSSLTFCKLPKALFAPLRTFCS